jgi:hypothetical protein
MRTINDRGLPLSIRVMNRLSSIIVDTGEVLRIVQCEDATTLAPIEPHLRKIFTDVDRIMQRLCD